MGRHYLRKHVIKSLLAIVTTAATTFQLAASAPANNSDLANIMSPQSAGWMKRAQLMLDNNNFAGVIDQLNHLYIDNPGQEDNRLLTQADKTACSYMLAIALFERGDEECVARLRQFIINNPASPLSIQASLAYGDYFLFKQDFAEALQAYNHVNINGLEQDQRNLYTYRKALCLIRCGNYAEACPLIAAIAAESEYSNAALFYDAYLDYAEGNFDSAYQKFMKVETNPDGKVSQPSTDQKGYRSGHSINSNYKSQGLEAGYYITQIEYTKGDYDNVINHGRALLQRRPVDELTPEINRIVGLSYFKKGDSSTAEQFLHSYQRSVNEDLADDARYALGVTSFERGYTTKAVEYFAPLVEERNALSQSASLYLGQCAASQGDNNSAAINFERASRMNFDNNVAESARYNLIVSRMRGGNVPFASDIRVLEDFLTDYPNSKYASIVRESLAQAYYNEHNYRRALESIDRISNPSKRIVAARQKVLYELGVELVSNSRPKEAITYLRQAAEGKQPDTQLAAQAWLWLGDAYHAAGDYKQATAAYNQAQKLLPEGDNKTLAIYNQAYSDFMNDDYATAAKRFKKAIDATPALPKTLRDDAIIRRADCLYYTGNYAEANTLYTQAVKEGMQSSDYAAFRNAVLPAASGDNATKMKRLQDFIAVYPTSKWRPDALLELGQTYSATGNNTKAIETYTLLANNYKASPQARKAMLNMAYTYNKLNNPTKAEETYRQIITNWASSEEAATAHEDLRRIYAASDRLDEYATFLNATPGAPSLSQDSREQLTFEAAIDALIENPADTKLLETYIERYPDGRYIAPALLELAKSDIANGQNEAAGSRLETIINLRSDSAEANEAMMLYANLLEKGGNDEKAHKIWQALEERASTNMLNIVYAGIMRTTPSLQERITYAEKVIESGADADAQNEAVYYQATAQLSTQNSKQGIESLTRLAANPKSETGAKAAVALGQHYIDTKQYATAEKVLSEFTETGTPHHYWLARGFIALADAYKGEGKTSLAMEYLQSLKENYPGTNDDIPSLIERRIKTWKK